MHKLIAYGIFYPKSENQGKMNQKSDKPKHLCVKQRAGEQLKKGGILLANKKYLFCGIAEQSKKLHFFLDEAKLKYYIFAVA